MSRQHGGGILVGGLRRDALSGLPPMGIDWTARVAA